MLALFALTIAVGCAQQSATPNSDVDSAPPNQIFGYSLEYTDKLPPTLAWEHQHALAALAGLANRDTPTLYTPYTEADAFWLNYSTVDSGWLGGVNVLYPVEEGDIVAIILQPELLRTVKGIVLWDPDVPATSNVASTAAGALSLIPVPYRPNDPKSLSNLLKPHSGLLPVKLSLVGKFNGSRTGSSKADAYVWAKETFLDSGLVSGTTLAYFVDYFAAVGVETLPAVVRRAGLPDHVVQGQPIGPGVVLLSDNGEFSLELRENGSLALHDVTGSQILWSTPGVTPPPDKCQLLVSTTGNASVTCGDKVPWSSRSFGSGGQFWLWMQHDGNLVLYQGTYPGPGKPLWSSNTVVPEKCGIPDNTDLTVKRRHWDAYGSAAFAEPPAIALAKVTNHDYFISHNAFFFDLSVWSDEPPNDDPKQPLGTDYRTLLTILHAAYNSGSSGGTEMLHIGGFVPWAYKYVKEGRCGEKCKHGGVETEWATVCVTSAFNAYVDADACCIGSFSNAALWQHAPLPAQLHQPTSSAPSLKELKARGYVNENGKVVQGFYAGYYGGDYDSAAWAYSQLYTKWNDQKRGDIPIGWALDPMVAARFPLIFQYVYESATPNDVFISGDSGGGYLNPSQLIPPRAVSNIATSGVPAFQKWNRRLYSRFNLSFTGFVINGDAGVLAPDAEAIYDNFSPAGIVVSSAQDHRGPSLKGGVTAAGTPVIHHVADLPGGNVSAAAQMVADTVTHASRQQPQFAVFRTILQTADFHVDVANAAENLVRGLSLKWVDPLTLGALVKLEVEAQNGSSLKK